MTPPKDKRERSSLTAEAWVMAAFRQLSTSSISEVKVERLAESLGVTKGSFYWHFTGRDDLLRAMRREWVRLDTEQVIELVDATGHVDDPVGALRRLLSITLGSEGELDGVEAAMREWSAGDPATAEVCAMVDERRVSYVADQLAAAGVDAAEARRRAEVLYRIVIGEYVWRRYGGAPIDVDAVLPLVEFLSRR